MGSPRDALIVFGKPPTAGRVKTRLQSLLTPEEAAMLYQAFLSDSLRQFVTIRAEVFVYFSEGPVPELVVADVTTREQSGTSLAERMRNAFLDVFALGADRAVVIGTDHPSLPTEFVVQAFDSMSGNRHIAVGPSEDGGYYLLGMSEFFPVLFENMTYSHDRVFDETVDRAASTQAHLTILPVWYDVDTPDQLPRLWRDLATDPDHSPATLDLLNKLAVRYSWI